MEFDERPVLNARIGNSLVANRLWFPGEQVGWSSALRYEARCRATAL
jgi:hypothetical protein